MFTAVLCFLLLSPSWAQQLNGTYMNVDYPGLSDACKGALNTSVSCPLFLSQRSSNGGILDAGSVNALCTDSCSTSLKNTRDIIEAACNSDTDTIVFSTGRQPASYIIQNYIFAYDVSCFKDSSTGEFCEPYILDWSDQTFLSRNQSCSECWLGGQALQLNSPLGYDEVLASNFDALTSSCDATGRYTISVPPTSTGDDQPSSTTSGIPTPTCVSSYMLQQSDYDCNAVARSLSVSTYGLLVASNMDLYCQNFPTAAEAGKTLCVPEKCKTYTWQPEDSCASVLLSYSDVNMAQFLGWNPNFNALCGNALKFIGPPGGYLDSNNTGDPLPGTSITSPVPAPTNADPETNRPCGRWYTVASGDECGVISVANGLTLADFYFLNPSIDANCTNLLLGVAYCVAPVGDITTYPGYPTTTRSGPWATITVPPVTFDPVNTAITTPMGDPGYEATRSLLPTASGTTQDCAEYRNFDGENPDLNACGYVAYAYDATVEQLREWNPSLADGAGECALQAGFSYCVEPRDSDTPSRYSCDSIIASLDVTLSQLLEWNSWLGTPATAEDCRRALFADLEYYDTRAVCIGVDGAAPPPPSSTSSAGTSTSSSSSSSPTSSEPPAPTQTGVVPGCREFYVVQEGDYCYLITEKFGIGLDEFVSWNPSGPHPGMPGSTTPLSAPSQRTPQFSTRNNTADRIERALAEDGHRLWGFVVYRCAYGDDAAWARRVATLRSRARETLEYYNGADLLDRFAVTAIEDRDALDGASAAAVRGRFKAWAAAAVGREQGTEREGLSQRYRYCVRISDEYDGRDDDEEYDEEEDFVDLIWRDWEPSVPDPREASLEPVEGCTRPDVGWMRVSARSVMVEMYDLLREQNAWYSEYRRPPEVVCR
ncbi:hypothetical protein AAE478_007503 [Parahypoxylon ruwenzoriense]